LCNLHKKIKNQGVFLERKSLFLEIFQVENDSMMIAESLKVERGDTDENGQRFSTRFKTVGFV